MMKIRERNMDIGIYIHIPFCRSKCFYCDFTSFPNKIDGSLEYCNYLLKEIALYKDILREYSVKTIFIGGGTPSYIDEKNIYKILNSIQDNFNCKALEEVTIEANPGTLNNIKLKVYKEAGVNRISLGLQSLNSDILKRIGRSHSVDDFYRDYELIKKSNIENINIDLMIGLPGQSTKNSLLDLENITDLNINHISLYSLILEENTKLYRDYEKGLLNLPSEEVEREMYHNSIEFLEDKGYIHYEISNFAKKDYQCKHNLIYWKLKPYVGFGLSAHSNINNRRYWNPDNFLDYYNELKKDKIPTVDYEYIDKEMEMAEYMILGLRLIDGVNREDFYNRFNIIIDKQYGDILKKHSRNGLIIMEEDKIKLSKRGLDLSNLVLMDILP